MASKGDGLTPKALGRIFLQKPPLLLWLSGLSMNLFGISLVSLRLPALIAGSLGAILVCCWCVRAGSWGTALAGVLLLLSDPVWHTFSRLAYTDMLLAVFTMAALYCVVRDPLLAGRRNFLGFCAATAGAIMTKNAAGVVPILILVLATACSPRGQRPSFRRIVQACLLIALFIAPWHVYQLMVHTRWFWTDYVQIGLLQLGLKRTEPSTAEFPLVFYGRRLFLVDPVLCILALIATPRLWTALRRRNSMQPILLAAWLIPVSAAPYGFQTPLFP